MDTQEHVLSKSSMYMDVFPFLTYQFLARWTGAVLVRVTIPVRDAMLFYDLPGDPLRNFRILTFLEVNM
jgi:hypothetical protein